MQLHLAVMVFFGAGIAALLMGQVHVGRLSLPVAVSLGAYMACFALALVRQGVRNDIFTAQYSVVQVVTWSAFAVFAVLVVHGWRSGGRSRQLAILAAAVFVGVNVVLEGLGLRPEVEGVRGGTAPGQLLSLLGLQGGRLTFPLSTSPTDFGVMAGAVGTTCLALALVRTTSRNVRVAAIVGVGLSVYGLLLTDSRGALIFAVIAVALALAQRHVRLRFTALIPLLIPFSATLILELADKLSSFDWATQFSRVGTGSIATASDRASVWQPVLDYVDQAPSTLIAGFGAYGQVSSGLSAAYSRLFLRSSTFADPRTTSTHNLGLQTLLDGGYIWLAVVVLLFVFSIANLARSAPASATATAALSGLLFFVLAGFTEATPTFYHPDALAAWLLLTVVALAPSESGVARALDGTRLRGP
jgi:hypothetical protein